MIDRLAGRAGRIDVRDLVAVGTVLTLIANTPRSPDALPFLVVLVVAMLAPLPIARTFRRSPWPWLGIAVAWTPFLVEGWWRHEDHEFLGVEHCAALALVLGSRAPRAALRVYARAMVVAIVGCALAWKLTAPTFLRGETFAWAIAHDARFAGIASVVGAGSGALATFMTAWTIVAEGAVVASFAAPDGSRVARLREPALSAFVASVYTLIPILGFGGLFLVLGLAVTRSPRWRAAMLALAAWLVLRLAVGLALG